MRSFNHQSHVSSEVLGSGISKGNQQIHTQRMMGNSGGYFVFWHNLFNSLDQPDKICACVLGKQTIMTSSVI